MGLGNFKLSVSLFSLCVIRFALLHYHEAKNDNVGTGAVAQLIKLSCRVDIPYRWWFESQLSHLLSTSLPMHLEKQ